ncbi:MAG: polysaccharide deacetylase family protein [Deltaproteobacteria bacterium]|nr:polysaccharide deacetylase family protein [Deltaproteobacteria bacterium]
MRGLKYAVKQGIMLTLSGIGPMLPRKHPPIFVYHSFDESGSCVSITPSLFREQMEFLKENGYRTLTISEMVKLYKEGSAFPEKSVALTFDDGLENNYTVAYPILRELGLTASIFLAVDYIGKACTWDKKPDIPDFPLMTWEMAGELGGYGIDLQSHTATHPHLTKLPDAEVREEVRRSKAVIEEKLGKKCEVLCYPYGEFNERVAEITAEEGYAGATAGHPEKEGLHSMRRVGSGHINSTLALKAALNNGFPLFYDMKIAARKIFSR